MMAITHTLFSIFVLILARLTGIPLSKGVVIAAILGSLLPDIDHPRSLIGRAVRPISTLLHETVGHRSLTHSITGLFAFGLLAYAATFKLGVGLLLIVASVVGYASHILADMLNSAGVELLYPHPRRYSLLPWGIRTGSIVEHVFSVCLFVAVVCGFLL